MLYSSMYTGVEGFYLSRRRGPREEVRRNLRHRVGFDAEGRWPEELESWAVTGIVDTCERRAEAADREAEAAERRSREAGDDTIHIVMLSGYCHYYPGPIIGGAKGTPVAAEPHYRLVGSRARERYGNLVIAEPGWRHYFALRRRAEAFREAIRSSDREKLSALHGRFGASRAELDYLLTDPASPFRELRETSDRPLVVLYRTDPRRRVRPDRLLLQDGYVCFCRRGDCADGWPISSIDTGHRTDHPYACIQMFEDDAGQRFLRAIEDPAPLREPPRTAFAST